jgi:hypothetical protein
MRLEREFKDHGVEVSTTLLANFRGTKEDAARAVEYAAQVVLDKHISGQGGLIQSQNQAVKVDLRDLEQFKQMLQKGKIGTLQKGNQDYWSDERRQDHALKIVKGGGSKAGRMTGDTLADHALKSCALVSQAAKDKHVLLLTIANGVEGDTEKWTCKARRDGTAVIYVSALTKPVESLFLACVSSNSSFWKTPTGLCRTR